MTTKDDLLDQLGQHISTLYEGWQRSAAEAQHHAADKVRLEATASAAAQELAAKNADIADFEAKLKALVEKAKGYVDELNKPRR